MNQLTLFAPQYDERVRRIEVEGVTYFSVLDVFEHFGSEGSAKNPAVYWERSKKRLADQGAESDLTGLLHRTPDNGGRPSPFAPLKFFFRLAQVVDIREWEHLRQWMAEIAHERIEETINPELGISRAQARARLAWERQGKDEKWIAARQGSVVDRNALTAAIHDTIHKPDYGDATDRVYIGLCEMTARQLKAALALPAKANLRDYLSVVALNYIRTAEAVIAARLRQFPEMITWEQAADIISDLAAMVGRQAQETSKALGTNIFTGQALIGAKQ